MLRCKLRDMNRLSLRHRLGLGLRVRIRPEATEGGVRAKSIDDRSYLR